MEKQCIITRLEGRTLAFYYEEQRLVAIEVIREEEQKEELKLGAIYTARIQNIVPGIRAAFLDIAGQSCYYSLEDNKHTIFLNPKKDSVPHVGDLLLVQIEKEPVKMKQAAATCYIKLKGEHTILTWQKPGVGISKKLQGDNRRMITEWMRECPKEPLSSAEGSYGFIVRTNAEVCDKEALVKETNCLKEKLDKLIGQAKTSISGKCIYAGTSYYRELLNQVGGTKDSRIITDVQAVYDNIMEERNEGCLQTRVEWYQDDFSLTARYELKKALSEVLKERVWLKSGGFLILEPTETLTVIDVNSGKNISKSKDRETLFLQINLEAAREIAKQIRLRNYSGIIIIDFIDMELKQNQQVLMEEFSRMLSADSVKTTLVDMTGLGLVEVTRHKIKKPFHEQWAMI